MTRTRRTRKSAHRRRPSDDRALGVMLGVVLALLGAGLTAICVYAGADMLHHPSNVAPGAVWSMLGVLYAGLGGLGCGITCMVRA